MKGAENGRKLNAARKLATVCTAVLCTIAATGCSFNFAADTLITPPKLSDEQRAIYDALISSAGNVDLKYPRTGDFRSAFVINDIDADGENEAIVFFEPRDMSTSPEKPEDSVGNLRVGFLDKDQNKIWHSVFDLPAQGTDIESVSFSTLGNSTGKNLLLVSYTTMNSSDKQLSVIDYANGKASEIARLTYTRMLIDNFSSEDKDELMLFSKKTIEEKQTAEFVAFGYDGGEQFSQIYNTVRFETEMSAFDSVSTGKCRLLDNISDFVMLNYSTPDGIYMTDTVYFTGKEYVAGEKFIRTDKNIFFTRKVNNFTPAMNPADINGDEVTDIPATQPLPGYESLTVPEQVNAFLWYNQTYQGKVRVAYTFINPGKNYILYFPERWVGMVTAKINFADSTVTFFKAEKDGDPKQELLSIRKVDTTATNPIYTDEMAASDGFKLFAKTDTYKLYVKNYQYEELSLTDDELEAALKLLPDVIGS